jgi:hypothetical protein
MTPKLNVERSSIRFVAIFGKWSSAILRITSNGFPINSSGSRPSERTGELIKDIFSESSEKYFLKLFLQFFYIVFQSD